MTFCPPCWSVKPRSYKEDADEMCDIARRVTNPPVLKYYPQLVRDSRFLTPATFREPHVVSLIRARAKKEASSRYDTRKASKHGNTLKKQQPLDLDGLNQESRYNIPVLVPRQLHNHITPNDLSVSQRNRSYQTEHLIRL
ncbi:hypothetical protein Bbelb_235810 [Branchiostoma belcheri]|nr:hypothetical protein Bbelb_235810 [Branchiostoma belcheri]